MEKLERLILSNQFSILEKLDPQQGNYYSEAREILENGYALEYTRFMEPFSNEFTADQCREVMDILDMYQFLGYAYDQAEDKAGLNPQAVSFPGFSGNEETEYMAYASFLKKTGQWEKIGNDSDGLNSHIPMPSKLSSHA